jgi:hypothetical protein
VQLLKRSIQNYAGHFNFPFADWVTKMEIEVQPRILKYGESSRKMPLNSAKIAKNELSYHVGAKK